MPQNTYFPLFRATYPILAPVQKPGGVTVSTTLPANAVPNAAFGAPKQQAAGKKANNASPKNLHTAQP